jgi:hypothetical protein
MDHFEFNRSENLLPVWETADMMPLPFYGTESSAGFSPFDLFESNMIQEATITSNADVPYQHSESTAAPYYPSGGDDFEMMMCWEAVNGNNYNNNNNTSASLHPASPSGTNESDELNSSVGSHSTADETSAKSVPNPKKVSKNKANEAEMLKKQASYFMSATSLRYSRVPYKTSATVQLVKPMVDKAPLITKQTKKPVKKHSDTPAITVMTTTSAPLRTSVTCDEESVADIDEAELNFFQKTGRLPATKLPFSFAESSDEEEEDEEEEEETPDANEFKGMGLSPKKGANGNLNPTRHPVMDALLRCVNLGMGARMLTWKEDNVRIEVKDFERLMRAITYTCARKSPTTQKDARVKTLRRWFEGIPRYTVFNSKKKAKLHFVMKSRTSPVNGLNNAAKLRAFARHMDCVFDGSEATR